MKIVDINDQEIFDPDLTLGYLMTDRIVSIHHDALPYIEDEGYYKVVQEYPNGGKDVEWVVTKPGQQAQDAWDEYEDVYRYILYTPEQIEERERERQEEEAAEQEQEELNRKILESAELINALLGVTE